MVIKQFFLLGLAAEYRSRPSVRSTLPPTIRCLWYSRRTKLTAPETLSRWLLLKERKNRSLSHPLGHLGVTYALCLWLVGSSCRLYIRRNWTFFAIFYGWDVMSGNRSKSALFEGGGSFSAQISEGRGHYPPTTVGVRKLQWLSFRVVWTFPQCII